MRSATRENFSGEAYVKRAIKIFYAVESWPFNGRKGLSLRVCCKRSLPTNTVREHEPHTV